MKPPGTSFFTSPPPFYTFSAGRRGGGRGGGRPAGRGGRPGRPAGWGGRAGGIHIFSSIWLLHTYSAARPGPKVENKWPHRSLKKVAVRPEAQRMNANENCTKANGTKPFRTLIVRNQPRPLAEIVDWVRVKTT